MSKTKNLKYRIQRNWNVKNGKPSKKVKRARVALVAIFISLIAYPVAFAEYRKLATGPLVFERHLPTDWGVGEQPDISETNPVSVSKAKDHTLALGDIEGKIKEVFGDDWKEAYAIAMAESGLRTDAIGDGHITYEYQGETIGMSCGLFQIRTLPGRPSCEEMLDPDKNIAFAKKLFDRSGWMPWSVYKSGKYLTYLK